MKIKKKKRQISLSASIINGIISMLVLFSILVSICGSLGYADALKKDYAESTYRMADTAAAIIDGDNLEKYLAEGEDENYRRNKELLEVYCRKIYVSLIYVIVVDRSDYGRFRCLYNTVCNEVDDTDYDEWELGHERDTTNNTYREKYKAIYEDGSKYETVYRLRITDGKKQHITTLVPVHNSKGEVVGILCMQRPMSAFRNRILIYLSVIASLATVFSIIAAVLVLKNNKKNFVIPIKKISEEAARFSKGDLEIHKLQDVGSIKEIADLSSSIEKMGKDMISYINHLTTITGERERITAELSIASTIQENSVPNTFPAFPDRSDFDVYASMTPAKAVGGDFYNFFLIDEDHLAVLIADVSGKGIPAALFMMVSNILITERTRSGGTPAEILEYINDRICKHNQADMFVTVWLGIIEISTGKVIATNAGHDDPAIYRKGEGFEIIKETHGLVMGAMESVKYRNYEFRLGEGDKLFIYTDGIPEATTADEQMFGIERMIEALNKYKDESPEGILNGINESVNEFVGDAPQFDDLTMLCVELKKTSYLKTLTLEASNDNLDKVMEFVDDILEESCCPMKSRMKVDLSVEEIFVNIANYAYGDETGDAKISAGVKDGILTIIFEDGGVPYNPLKKPDPDIGLSAEERKIGGLGIYLVKKNMTSVSYDFKEGKNVLTLTKDYAEDANGN